MNICGMVGADIQQFLLQVSLSPDRRAASVALQRRAAYLGTDAQRH
jgi:hypothetical protein